MAFENMDKDTTIMRYMNFNSFIRILKNSALFLPVAVAYETTDINEGRFTTSFVRRMKEIFKEKYKEHAVRGVSNTKEYKANLKWYNKDLQNDLAVSLSALMAARECVFVSCWTYRQEENSKMWKEFGENSTGIAIRSTIRKVENALESVMNTYSENNIGDDVDLVSHRIIYAREELHRWLTKDNIQDFLLPLFFLDGPKAGNGVKKFWHEKEYRFVAYDLTVVFDNAGDKLQDPDIQLRGNYIKDFDYGKRANSKRPYGKLVTINLEDVIEEIIIGANTSVKNRMKIERFIDKSGLDIAISKSKLK